ncbi:hypothetical protein [Vulgatibacter sp.]|uniref:hypothetical protein n=1 Tax=Vulgatibacter sp. TaxID=1971226 RepID=UPI00356B61D7
MASEVAEFRSETAYDALQDGLSLVVRVLSEPASVEELVLEGDADRATVEKRLRRLERAGILKVEDGRWQPVARMVVSSRQEGMVTFLSRYMLPSFVQLVREPNQGFIAQLDLVLDAEAQRGLRGGLVQELLKELNALSDVPGGPRRPGTLVVVGTSNVPAPAAAEDDRILETVRRCARQRTVASEAERAVLTFYSAMYAADRLGEAEALVRRALEKVASGQVEGRKPNYTLVIGFRADLQRDAGESK